MLAIEQFLAGIGITGSDVTQLIGWVIGLALAVISAKGAMVARGIGADAGKALGVVLKTKGERAVAVRLVKFIETQIPAPDPMSSAPDPRVVYFDKEAARLLPWLTPLQIDHLREEVVLDLKTGLESVSASLSDGTEAPPIIPAPPPLSVPHFPTQVVTDLAERVLNPVQPVLTPHEPLVPGGQG